MFGLSSVLSSINTFLQARHLTICCVFFETLSHLVGQKLPYTLSPEYLAAQRAYMRYHNMNPIWGISSK